MTRLTFVTLASLSLALAGCQKTRLSQVQKPAPAAANFSPAPAQPLVGNGQPQVPPGGQPIPADTTIRTPSPEPLDPPVIVMPPPVPVQPPAPPRYPSPEPRDPTPPTQPPRPPTTPPTTYIPDPPRPPVTQPQPPVQPRPQVPVQPPAPPRYPSPEPRDPTPPTQPPVVNPPVPLPRPEIPVVNPPPPTHPAPPPIVVTEPPVEPLPVQPLPIQPLPVQPVPVETRPVGLIPAVANPPIPVARPEYPYPAPIKVAHQAPPPTTVVTPQTVVKRPAWPGHTTPVQPVVVAERPVGTPAPGKPVPTARPEYDPCSVPGTCGPVQPVDGTCTPKPVTVAKENKVLDILFVVDTSASLVKGPQGSHHGGELQQIAYQMENFVNQLEEGTDVHIGVLLGHGPQSKYFGKLFSVDKNDPAVLSWDSRKMNKAAKKAVWKALERKMKNVPNDSGEAQGEALMLNIYESINNPSAREKIIKQGLFRQDTKLAIIAVTDEQDVCWSYPASPVPYPSTGALTVNADAFTKGLVPVLKPMASSKKGHSSLSPDVHEMNFYKNVCTNYVYGKPNASHTQFSGGEPLTPLLVKTVLQSLENYRHLKVLMNLIAYGSNLGLSATASNEDENEMANGLIQVRWFLGAGEIADLKDVKRKDTDIDFTRTLNLLGESVRLQMKMTSSFDCSSNYHPDAIDLDSISVDVVDQGSRQRLAHFTKQCSSAQACQQGDGGLKSEIIPDRNQHIFLRVSPLDQTAFMKSLESKNIDKVDYEIHYRTKENYNVKTGKPTLMPAQTPQTAPPVRTASAQPSVQAKATSRPAPVAQSVKAPAKAPVKTPVKTATTAVKKPVVKHQLRPY